MGEADGSDETRSAWSRSGAAARQLGSQIGRFRAAPRDLRIALLATLFFGAASGIFLATLNNYLAEVHRLDAVHRGWLELPRELPGFLVMFVTGLMLIVLRETQIAALAMLFTAIGALGLGFLSTTTATLALFVMIWSMGDHNIFAVEGPIGLKLAHEGKEGRRLGQFGGFRDLGGILGVGTIFRLARLFGTRFGLIYALASACALIAGALYLRLHVGRTDVRSRRLIFKKKYGLFYTISALFGIRKQIFIVFGAWVLVDLHGVPLGTIALLYFIASTLGKTEPGETKNQFDREQNRGRNEGESCESGQPGTNLHRGQAIAPPSRLGSHSGSSRRGKARWVGDQL